MKQFVCVCGSVFTSEDSLNKHIFSHSKSFNKEEKEDIEYVLNCIKEVFPSDEIEMKSGDGWYTKYRIIIKRGNTVIEQRLGNDPNRNRYPEKIENAINEIRRKFAIIEHIEKGAMSLGGFSDFYCDKFDYRYSDYESYYSFFFKLNNSDDWKQVNFYPNKKGENDVSNFISSLRKYVISSVEGKVSTTSNGYHDKFFIDNIDISSLLERGKKVKLEIID